MTGDRYVLLGLAPPRAPWFEALAQWATSASIAAEFVKCVSAEEVGARLASGRPHSAVLVDAASPSFDRDLVDSAVRFATPVIVVRDDRGPSYSARDLGVTAEIGAAFTRDELMDTLASHCRQVGRATALPPGLADESAPVWQGRMFAVCGPGGTGASTVAMALAQGLARDPRYGRRVVLADLALRADQAMFHDAVELGPGLQELVEAHRVGRPSDADVARGTFDVPRRGYRLLLGLRQPEAWSALRPRTIDATVEGLRRSFEAVVADVYGDVEGEDESGSADVEERNHLARTATRHSTVTLAVGNPGIKGVHSLANLVRALVRSGVPADRIVAVMNRSPRHPGGRAESARALGQTLVASGVTLALAAPVHVPERKLDDTLRDGAPLPAAIVDPVTRAAGAVADRLADAAPVLDLPVRLTPGSLGSLLDDPEVDAGP